MRVPSFYSHLRGIALTDVWHDNDECPLGRSIAPADRIRGTTDIRHRCAYCAMLDAWPAMRHPG
jgi:hypothetical protein